MNRREDVGIAYFGDRWFKDFDLLTPAGYYPALLTECTCIAKNIL